MTKKKVQKENFKPGRSKEEQRTSCQAEEAEAETEELWSEVKCSKLEKLYNTVPDRGIVSTQQQRKPQHNTVQYITVQVLHSTTTAQQHCTDRTTNYSFSSNVKTIHSIYCFNQQQTENQRNCQYLSIRHQTLVRTRLTTSLKHKIRGLESLSFRHPTLERLRLTTSLKQKLRGFEDF